MKLPSTATAIALLACIAVSSAEAQRVAPVAVTNAMRGDVVGPGAPGVPDSVRRPRTRVVAPLAFAFGVAGGVAGYFAAEEECARTQAECWAHYGYVPLGYAAGVALGGGLAGTTEGCRSAVLRAIGGTLLGVATAATAAFVNDGLVLVTLPLAPVVGATWLVTSCRTPARTAPAVDG